MHWPTLCIHLFFTLIFLIQPASAGPSAGHVFKVTTSENQTSAVLNFLVVSGDPGDYGHCLGTACGAIYPKLLSAGVRAARHGGTGILAVGVHGGTALESLMSWNLAENGGPEVAITHVRSLSEIESVDFTQFALVYVPSQGFGSGGLTREQAQALQQRRDDLAEFQRLGGAMIVLAQLDHPEWGFLPGTVMSETEPVSAVIPDAKLLDVVPEATQENLSQIANRAVFKLWDTELSWKPLLRTVSGEPLMLGNLGGDIPQNIAPLAGCSAVQVNANSSCQACVSINAGSFDPQGLPLSYSQSPGCNYPVGSHQVTLNVTNSIGLADTCSTQVLVVDTTGPELRPRTVTLWPANHKTVDLTLAQCVQATDNCGGEIAVDTKGQIVSVASDEPEDATGNGDGNTRQDIVILSDTSFRVRAERAGGGNGRVYSVAYRVVDPAGNWSAGSCEIHVPHSRNQGAAINNGVASGYVVRR